MDSTTDIKYDYYGRVEPAQFILASPDRSPICILNSVDESSVNISLRSNNTHELTFNVYKYIDGEPANGYAWIDEQMEIYCDGIWFNINNPPEIQYDSYDEYKSVTAESDEIKLTQYPLVNFAVNQGTEYSYEYVYKQKHDPNSDKYYQVKFYDKDNPELSFLDLIIYHAAIPGWKIGYVDNVTVNPSDGKTFLPNEVVNFNVEEENVYAFLTQEVASVCRCVFEFDTKNMLINVYRGESLGKDTNVILDFNNVQNSLTISRENPLVTVFNVSGEGDTLNIDFVNPVGGSLIEDLSYFCKEPYMSKDLIAKYKAWVDLRDSYLDQYVEISKQYNDALNTLSEIETRVPSDTIQNNWYSASVGDLKIAYDDYQAIIAGLQKIYVDEEGNFDLEALKNSPDWKLYESIMNYILPTIISALQGKGEPPQSEEKTYGTGNLIKNPVPTALGQAWNVIGSNQTVSCISIRSDQPDYGITSGVSLVANSGIRQENISVLDGKAYCLSVYVKAEQQMNLSMVYGVSDGTPSTVTNTIAAGSWQRIFKSFTTQDGFYDVSFTADGPCIISGMQLELGSGPTAFSFYKMNDNELKAYETDWDLYGITELKTKAEVYDNSIQTLSENGFDKPYTSSSKHTEAYHTAMYQKYLDYLRLKEQCLAALEKRQQEYEAAKRDDLNLERQRINSLLQLENFGDAQSEYPGFTEKELVTLKLLRSQATYENPNIIVTSLDTLSDRVDIQLRLYQDAMEQLYVESHPQYIYSDSLDNMLALPEFQEYHGDLSVNNFIRIGIDDEDTYVKLRLIEISYNPCTLDNNISVVFSNMVQYRSRRDDLASLIGYSENKSARGAVVSSGSNDVTQFIVTSDIIRQLFSNPAFQSQLGGVSVGGAGSGGTGGKIDIDAGTIVAELVKADEGVFETLTADTAFMKYLSVQLISADKIVTELLQAEEAEIGELTAKLVTSETVVTQLLQADKAYIDELSAKLIDASTLNADIANIKNLLAGNAGVGELQAINLTADNVVINDAVIKNLIAAKISVADLMTHSATAELITLISEDGKPSIAFKNSTQQFYDSLGNVRVQIGQDGNGDFNFVVRGEDGTTALFDSNGIKKEGIPDNTIVNDMLEDATIQKAKLGFPIVETDENGKVSITEILDGEGGEFGVRYTNFEQSTSSSLETLSDGVSTLSDAVNELSGQVQTIELTGPQVFTETGGTINPESITLTATAKNGLKIGKWYIDDVENTSYVSEDKTTITIPASYMADKRTITVRVEGTNPSIYDVMSLYRVVEGESGYTVVISSSNGTTFRIDSETSSSTATCTVYQGAKVVEPNSYTWYCSENESNPTKLGTGKSITLPLTKTILRKSLYCEVDI